MQSFSEKFTWPILRIAMGWYFFWPFLDKVFGLGFNTPPGKAWINGISPAYGFLAKATKGPFAHFFQAMAGNPSVDWLFMMGLMLIGLSLIFGVALRLACFSGTVMLILFYLAGFIWPAHNPFLDEHIINAILLIGLAGTGADKRFGLGRWWTETRIAKAIPLLR